MADLAGLFMLQDDRIDGLGRHRVPLSRRPSAIQFIFLWKLDELIEGHNPTGQGLFC